MSQKPRTNSGGAQAQFLTVNLASISQPGVTADELSSCNAVVPGLAERFIDSSSTQDVLDRLEGLFPEASWFGLGLLTDAGSQALLVSGNILARAPIPLTKVSVDSLDGLAGAGAAGRSTTAEATSSSDNAAPATAEGTLLCVPLRRPAGHGEDKQNGENGFPNAAEAQEILKSRGLLTVSREARRKSPFGYVAIIIADDQGTEGVFARLTALALCLEPVMAAPGYVARAAAATSQPEDAADASLDPRLPSAIRHALSDGARQPISAALDFADSQLEQGLLSVLQGGPAAGLSQLASSALLRQPLVSAGAGITLRPFTHMPMAALLYSQQYSNQYQQQYHSHHSQQGKPPPAPCTTPEIQQLLNEILETHSQYVDEFGASSNSESAVVAHAETSAAQSSSTGTIVLPGPDDVQGNVHLLRPEDRWFEQHWLWLNFKDPELEKRFNWWHNRQCVKLDSGFCWFSFALLVVLLTMEPYSLAKYHPNAFPLAFLIVPGVYILHRWDTDWYIKRRHAVIMVQATYYMVYMVIFVTPVFLQVKSPASLRRPLWLLRITGVECMLMQLCFQVPFEKFFWMGILHLGIVSSQQRTICEHLYPDTQPGRCTSLLTGLQLLLGFALTMAIGRYLENWRRRSFLKHVRAERPDPKAQPRKGKQGRKALKEAARELEAAGGAPSAVGAGPAQRQSAPPGRSSGRATK